MESTTTVNYSPEVGVLINEVKLPWGIKRAEVIKLINGKFEGKNSVIDMSPYNDGSNDFDIHQRRDVFQEIDGNECLIFFNYDKQDLLRDIEVHGGAMFIIEDVKIGFENDFDLIIDELIKKYEQPKEVDYQTFLFEKIKMVVSSDEAMGGVGNSVAYLYVSNDVSHLLG